jgi:hypothetical protein
MSSPQAVQEFQIGGTGFSRHIGALAPKIKAFEGC